MGEKSASFKRITYFKIYLTNPSLRSALFSPIDFIDAESGNLVETAIFAQCMYQENISLRYARWNLGRSEGEVDMISIDPLKQKARWSVAVKWQIGMSPNPVS